MGPFRREELVQQLRSGAVLPSHYYFEEGMSGWDRIARLPCCHKFLATDAQKQMLDRMGVEYSEFLTKADVSAILQNQPATQSQLEYLRSFGVTPSNSLTKSEASQAIERCLEDPVSRQRQSEFRAAELERLHREREAFPSYWLKQDAIAAERELSELNRMHADERKELVQYRHELKGIQQRLAKAENDDERKTLEQQSASTQQLIELAQEQIDDQPSEIDEAKQDLSYCRSLRKKFWKATFTQLGGNPDDTEDLIDYCDVIDRLYD